MKQSVFSLIEAVGQMAWKPTERLTSLLWLQQLGLILKPALWRCVLLFKTCMERVGSKALQETCTLCPLCPDGTHTLSHTHKLWPEDHGKEVFDLRGVQSQISMRRFFKAQRDEDYSQIQYLTAKCTRLAHDKGKSRRSRLQTPRRRRTFLFHFALNSWCLRFSSNSITTFSI